MIRTLTIILITCACLTVQAQVNIITTICGDGSAGYSGDKGNARNATLNVPSGICLDKLGNAYIADGLNHRIRKIELATNIITTVAGSGIAGFSGDGGAATDAELFIPEAVCCDADGNIFFADAGNNRIRKINRTTNVITTVAGSGATGIGSGSMKGDGGAATNAELSTPSGICIDKYGNLYIADYGNNKVRKVELLTGIITTYAGKGTEGYTGGALGYSGDGGPAINAVFSGPIGLIADVSGNVFICDQWNHSVRKITFGNNIITTVAGKGIAGYSGDYSLATSATLNQPAAVYVDKNNDIYIAEYQNGTIRKINGATGVITTVVGNGSRGSIGDEGLAINAELKCNSVFLDTHGVIYIADMDNNKIRKVSDTMQHYTKTQVAHQNNNIKLYPNPATNELTIEGAANSNVMVSNAIGQQVLKVDKLNTVQTIYMGGLLPGIYIVTIIDPESGSSVIRRIVKE